MTEPGGSSVATDWHAVHERLSARGESSLSGTERDLLADALFWLDRVEESVAARRGAYQAHCEAADDDRAALATWRLFYDHLLVGEAIVAGGWIERCRRHVGERGATVPAGWLAIAEADLALQAAEPALAVAHAARAQEIGRRSQDRDLVAMALQAQGRAEIEAGQRVRGLSLLDEAMVAVINDELQPLYTGWVYCNVVATCYGLADLRRASEWSEAALRWCATLRDGLMYPGLCRVYAAELAVLRGDWSAAEVGARRACNELSSHDVRYAGPAFYLVGEVKRLRGDLAGAVIAYERASELGCLPQPGLGLLRLAQGRTAEALSSLRSALTPGPGAPLPRGQLLAALVDAAVEQSELTLVEEACGELRSLASASASRLVAALADGAAGRRALASGDPGAALSLLRAAHSQLRELGVAYDASRYRLHIGNTLTQLGDTEGARLELSAAAASFAELGAAADSAIAQRQLAAVDSGAMSSRAPSVVASGTVTSPLTDRELDVLLLVAEGCTNRQIGARLHLSRHTVARHVSSILTKLQVSTRAAATRVAAQRGLLADQP